MGDITSTAPTAPLESRKDFEDNPSDQYRYWLVELDGSERNLRGFTRQGNEIVKRYLAGSPSAGDSASQVSTSDGSAGFRMNLFYANTVTLEATLYGSVPKIDVSRRYADSSDDVGRVAAEIMERFLNNDIAENGSETECVLRTGLQDRLIVGLGCARVMYSVDFEDDDDDEMVTSEDAYLEYVHWRDVRWGWARSFAEIKWIGFRAYLTKDEAEKRFGKEAKNLTYKAQQALDNEDSLNNDDNSDSWMKAEVWEIWDKVKRQVVWVSKGYDKVLDTKQDTLKLRAFYPCAPFFIANATSTLYVPTADYHLTQDLYNEIDKLQTRIAIITEAVKVVGVYNADADGVQRMMNEGVENDLIPIDNWALFAEKGGLVTLLKPIGFKSEV